MKDIIEILCNEHRIIDEKIKQLDEFTNLKEIDLYQPLQEILQFLKNEITEKHHRRENEVLYTWMVEQNKNADTELINRIISEHNYIDKLIQECLNIMNKPQDNYIALKMKILDLTTSYKAHMEKEEKFIFQIANALKCSNRKSKELLNKLIKIPRKA